jgi:protein ImuA
MRDRMQTLASLRGELARLETPDGGSRPARVALGHEAADASLKGGLVRGAVHEVFAPQEAQGAAATGFTLGLVRRVTSSTRFALWIRQDFSALRTGELAMSGFSELGLDPRFVILVRAANAEMALRVAADGLACNAFGAVVTELWGATRSFDGVASRKLTLASQASGATGLMLRRAASPEVSTAETRWIVRGARSPPGPVWRAWGEPVFDAELVRNRHGPTGRWIMHWNSDDHLFHENDSLHQGQPAHSQPAFPQIAHRPLQAGGVQATGAAGRQRRGSKN